MNTRLRERSEAATAPTGVTMHTMDAAVQHRYGAPTEVVRLEERAVPEPKPDQVLVRVRAAGVNWADKSLATGTPYVMRLGYGLRRPRIEIRGTDVAGVVERVGSAVTALRPGDEVFGWCTGAFAEHVVVKADHLVGKPAQLTFEQAAAIPMAGCVAIQVLRDVAKIKPGDKVLVNGASGGIGSFVVQIARSYGADVTGVCSTANLAFVRELGANRVIDYTAHDFTADDFSSDADRYDLIFDIADNKSLRQRRRALTRNGTLIPNSGEGGPWVGSIGRIFKAWFVSPFVSQKLRPFLSVAKRDDLLALCALIDSGALNPKVETTYPLSETGAAIRHAGSGHARGKIVVSIPDHEHHEHENSEHVKSE